MKPVLSILIIVLTFGAVYSNAQEFDEIKLKKAETKLRPTVNNNRKVYIRAGDESSYYIHEDSNMFPVRKAEAVRITSVKNKSGYAEIKFVSKYLGTGRIKVFARSGSPLFDEAVRTAFILGSAEQERKSFVLNTKSNVVHFAGCNHLPKPEDRKSVTKEGLADGSHKKCPLCFYTIPKVKGYDLELRLSRSHAGFVASNFPVMTMRASSERVERIATKILENWMMPLKGYRYKFYVVEGDNPNAFASPGGRIYVTTGMLEVIESDEELEAILAHEIAHIELRHGYRQFRSLRKAQFWGGLIAAVAGAYDKKAYELATAISQMTTAIVLSGHSRKYESEADSLAYAYIEQQKLRSGHRSWLSVLKKLQYHQDFFQPDEDDDKSLLASHPNIAERIDVVENSKMSVFPKGTVFKGYNSAGDLVATLTFEAQRVYTGSKNEDDVGLQILATVETTSALAEDDDIEKIKLETDIGTIALDNKEDTQVFPNDSVGTSFSSKSVRKLVGEIKSVRLDLKNVSVWKRDDAQ